MATAWLVLAAGDDRQHGGNDGYDDDPSSTYRWDDTVPNHGTIANGDAIVLWDKRTVIGASVIERIDEDDSVKNVYRCSHCGKAHIKRRKRMQPAWRCFGCSTNFETPLVEAQPVHTYASRHEVGWVDLDGVLDGAQLCRAARGSRRAEVKDQRFERTTLSGRTIASIGAHRCPWLAKTWGLLSIDSRCLLRAALATCLKSLCVAPSGDRPASTVPAPRRLERSRPPPVRVVVAAVLNEQLAAVSEVRRGVLGAPLVGRRRRTAGSRSTSSSSFTLWRTYSSTNSLRAEGEPSEELAARRPILAFVLDRLIPAVNRPRPVS